MGRPRTSATGGSTVEAMASVSTKSIEELIVESGERDRCALLREVAASRGVHSPDVRLRPSCGAHSPGTG